jgi:hypothetical protein
MKHSPPSSSIMNCGTCVVLPQPVSPVTTTTCCAESEPRMSARFFADGSLCHGIAGQASNMIGRRGSYGLDCILLAHRSRVSVIETFTCRGAWARLIIDRV